MDAGGVIGREEELAALAAFLDDVPVGPAQLVLVGEAGVGKTTLWCAGADEARERGYRVLETRPAEAEARLAFAGLGDLLDPVLGEVLDPLPTPQRDALRVALLLERATGVPPEERAVAVAVLSALRNLAADRPTIVAVDDLQWLDSPSAAVLGFAWRRLRDERASLLVARRVGEPVPVSFIDDGRTRELEVAPLSLGAVHRLVQARLGLVLSRPTLRRVYEVAAGNAFFALELARALRREGVTLVGGEPLPVPSELRDLVRDRLVVLPQPTRKALAAAAAVSQPTLALVAAAAGGEDALRPALEAHVLELDGPRLRFGHPLLASAAYEDVDILARRALHQRLAELVGDEEERARHLALAAEAPDETIAAALEHAAAHARARGASVAAAELCEEARRLTPSDLPEDLYRRTMAAARYRFTAGDMARARTLLEEVLGQARGADLRAEALVLLGRLHRYEGDQPRAAELLRRALAETKADERVRAEAAQGLAATLFFMREDLEVALGHAQLAAKLAARAGSFAVLMESLEEKGLIEALLGRSEAATTLRAARELGGVPAEQHLVASPSYAWAVFLCWTDELEDAAVGLRQSYEEAGVRGDESSASMILANLAVAEYLAGRWQEAGRVAEEGYELALQTGQRPQQAWAQSIRALVRASLGQELEARADAAEALALAGERAMGVARVHAVWALGLLELSLERPAEAARLLASHRERLLAAGVCEPGTIRFVPDEIEALVMLGRLEDAEALVDWLEARASELDRASAFAAGARCRGLLAAARGETDAALAAFERALAQHDRIAMPFDRARTLLVLGATQRRARQKSAARRTIADALAAFEQLGAGLWALKARAEVARIGGRAASRDDLTPAEERVAALVAEGRTNREVAAALFVSEHTVEFHLSRIYRKLGLRSRAELARHFHG